MRMIIFVKTYTLLINKYNTSVLNYNIVKDIDFMNNNLLCRFHTMRKEVKLTNLNTTILTMKQ